MPELEADDAFGAADGTGSLGTFFAANRKNWDERTSVHMASAFYDVEGWLATARGPAKRELELLGSVEGLDLVHLQCHFGLDTLAWARVGARVVGLDFSAAALEQARVLAERANLADRAEFVCANVYDACVALGHRTFDVVYVSLGSLCWLPSATRWAEQVCGLLAPNGRLLVHDVHPFSMSLSAQGTAPVFSYFEEPQPIVDEAPATYTDGQELSQQRNYQWNHSLAEVIGPLMSGGLRLELLQEHDWTAFRQFPWLTQGTEGWTAPPGHARLPLSFTLLACKTVPSL